MTASTAQEKDEIREVVRRRYATAATRVAREGLIAESGLQMLDEAACCGTESCSTTGPSDRSVITSDLYAVSEVADLPAAAVLASLGCGNPTALAQLNAGETVLDLGSGGGIDVLLSARRVGPTGFAYGLDMTDEMLALAEKNRIERRVDNVRFLKGQIEQIPLPDASVDVVISNCVINLSGDKPSVLREAFRVLKPGGRFAVSDVVVQGELPAPLRQSMELFVGCIAGALEEDTYRKLLEEAGFAQVGLEVTRVYDAEGLAASECCGDTSVQAGLAELTATHGRIVSAFVRATKPVTDAALSETRSNAR
jgi:SAM-dependent methyltransferase